MPAMARLDDKVAVVTGAAHGLGRAIAERLAGEGATVVLGDVDAPALDRAVAQISGKGGRASGVVGDVTEEEPAARLIAAAVERGGRLDILVNNVGGSRTRASGKWRSWTGTSPCASTSARPFSAHATRYHT